MDSKGFSVQPHKIRHGNMVNSTGMADVFLGDLVMTPGSRKMFSSSGEFSDENYFTILIKIKLLSGEVDYDS